MGIMRQTVKDSCRPIFDHRNRGDCRVCMLMITHACNLNCTYCYEAYKDDSEMSFEMAKKIVLKEIDFVKDSGQFKRLEVDFMGGEPFMNFKLIKQVVEWLESLSCGIPIAAFCSTNGTLVTPEKYSWLGAHRKMFVAGLSYDGTAWMQEKNRSGRQVDLEFFKRTWPEQWVRITVSKGTIGGLCEGVLSLQRKGIHVQLALAQGENWDEMDAEIFKRELVKLASFYLTCNDYKPVDFLTRPLSKIGKGIGKAGKTCGAGTGLVTYDIDGTCYPCHMFTPVVLGSRSLPLDKACFCCETASLDKHCLTCCYLNWCSSCYGFNYFHRGDVFKRDCKLCMMIDVHARACCEFQLKYYYANRSRLSKADSVQVRIALDTYAFLSQHQENWKTAIR